MKATIVIPSYWGRRSTEPFNVRDAVYDHPTMLDLDGTLGRCLDSLKVLKNRDFNVVVLACATAPDIAQAVEEKVGYIVSRYRGDLEIACVSHSFETRMKEYIQEADTGPGATDPELISLTGYSNIRNMCLVVAELARSEMAVLLDDDEVYEDPEYLDKVFEDIGSEFEGKAVGALAGYYIRPEGGYLLPPPEEWWWTEWPMVDSMNEAFSIIEEGPRLKKTPFVFGGNMVIHRDVYRSICFDPNVRRGEDIDFLMNAKFFDIDFLLDRTLSIRHLPPKTNVPAWQHFRENVYRFVYARAKLNDQRPVEGLRMLTVEDFDPYPGRCMRSDLEEMIFRTCMLMGLYYMHEKEELAFQECMKSIHMARFHAPPQFDTFDWYLRFRERWESLMLFLAEDETLSGMVLSGM